MVAILCFGASKAQSQQVESLPLNLASEYKIIEMVPDQYGGVLLLAELKNEATSTDYFWLANVSSDMSISWEKKLTINNGAYRRFLNQSAKGDIFLLLDRLLFKFDRNGNQLASVSLEKYNLAEISNISITPKGGIAMIGAVEKSRQTLNQRNADLSILILDANLKFLDSIEIGGVMSESAHDAAFLPNGRVVIAAGIDPGFDNEEATKAMIVSLDSMKRIEWILHRDWYISGYGDSHFFVEPLSDGSVVTYVFSNQGYKNVSTIIERIDQNGRSVWKRNFPGSANLRFQGDMAMDSKQNIYLAGSMNDAINSWIALLDTDGQILYSSGLDSGESRIISQVAVSIDGEFWLAGKYNNKRLLKTDAFIEKGSTPNPTNIPPPLSHTLSFDTGLDLGIEKREGCVGIVVANNGNPVVMGVGDSTWEVKSFHSEGSLNWTYLIKGEPASQVSMISGQIFICVANTLANGLREYSMLVLSETGEERISKRLKFKGVLLASLVTKTDNPQVYQLWKEPDGNCVVRIFSEQLKRKAVIKVPTYSRHLVANAKGQLAVWGELESNIRIGFIGEGKMIKGRVVNNFPIFGDMNILLYEK